MPDPKKDEEIELKVIDRRPFTSEGERRPDVPESEPAKPEPPRTSEQPKKAANSSAAVDGGAGAARTSATQPAAAQAAPPPPPVQGPIQFEHLIMSLVTSTMMQLGMAARPGEAPPPPDLSAAQETIDLLAMLQQKTKGNLTPEEAELLEGSLAELRMAFVELSRRASSRLAQMP